MTALPVHTCCQYLTVLGGWRDIDYHARVIVKSVKGEPFKGRFDIKVDGKNISLTQENMDVGLDVVAKVIASRLVELATGPVTLVPVPNSHAHVGAAPAFRTLLLAQAIATHSGGIAKACPALLWAEARTKQHQGGGWRSATQFHPHLRIAAKVETPIILIDDVVTSGSQMLACAYVLRKTGAEVPFGMAVGRTVREQTPHALEWQEEMLTQLIL